jgi:hypothetical protein
MFAAQFDYKVPKSLDEAVSLLAAKIRTETKSSPEATADSSDEASSRSTAVVDRHCPP